VNIYIYIYKGVSDAVSCMQSFKSHRKPEASSDKDPVPWQTLAGYEHLAKVSKEERSLSREEIIRRISRQACIVDINEGSQTKGTCLGGCVCVCGWMCMFTESYAAGHLWKVKLKGKNAFWDSDSDFTTRSDLVKKIYGRYTVHIMHKSHLKHTHTAPHCTVYAAQPLTHTERHKVCTYNIHMYIYIYIYIYIHTHTYIHITAFTNAYVPTQTASRAGGNTT
jgi:hypothetical protein